MKILALVAIVLVVAVIGVGAATSSDALFSDVPALEGYGSPSTSGGTVSMCSVGDPGCDTP